MIPGVDKLCTRLMCSPLMKGGGHIIDSYMESANHDTTLLGEWLIGCKPDNAVLVVLDSYRAAIVSAWRGQYLVARPHVWLATGGALTEKHIATLSKYGNAVIFIPSAQWLLQWDEVLIKHRPQQKFILCNVFEELCYYDLPTAEQSDSAAVPKRREAYPLVSLWFTAEEKRHPRIGKLCREAEEANYVKRYAHGYSGLGELACSLDYVWSLPIAAQEAFVGSLFHSPRQEANLQRLKALAYGYRVDSEGNNQSVGVGGVNSWQSTP